MLPVIPGQKVIVSPLLALANAARNEPGPLSRVFCTVFVHTGGGANKRNGAAHKRPRVKEKPKMFLRVLQMLFMVFPIRNSGFSLLPPAPQWLLMLSLNRLMITI